MLIDDGFSVLDADFSNLNQQTVQNGPVNEVKVVKIPTNQIFPNPYQPRKTFSDESLAD